MFNAASVSSPDGGRNCFASFSLIITLFGNGRSSAIAFDGNNMKIEGNVSTGSKRKPVTVSAITGSRI